MTRPSSPTAILWVHQLKREHAFLLDRVQKLKDELRHSKESIQHDRNILDERVRAVELNVQLVKSKTEEFGKIWPTVTRLRENQDEVAVALEAVDQELALSRKQADTTQDRLSRYLDGHKLKSSDQTCALRNEVNAVLAAQERHSMTLRQLSEDISTIKVSCDKRFDEIASSMQHACPSNEHNIQGIVQPLKGAHTINSHQAVTAWPSDSNQTLRHCIMLQRSCKSLSVALLHEAPISNLHGELGSPRLLLNIAYRPGILERQTARDHSVVADPAHSSLLERSSKLNTLLGSGHAQRYPMQQSTWATDATIERLMERRFAARKFGSQRWTRSSKRAELEAANEGTCGMPDIPLVDYAVSGRSAQGKFMRQSLTRPANVADGFTVENTGCDKDSQHSTGSISLTNTPGYTKKVSSASNGGLHAKRGRRNGSDLSGTEACVKKTRTARADVSGRLLNTSKGRKAVCKDCKKRHKACSHVTVSVAANSQIMEAQRITRFATRNI